MSWQRARSQEQVDERKEAILGAAAKIFHDMPYEKVTVQKIGKEIDFSRANIYRYFNSLEEIYLTLYIRDVDSWFEAMKTTFTQKEESCEAFVSKWTKLMCQQTRYLELNSMFNISLEKNTSEEFFRASKIELFKRIDGIVNLLEVPLPEFSFEERYELLAMHHTIQAGSWPASQLSDMQKSVMDDLGIGNRNIDFCPYYEISFLTYLNGMKARKNT